MEDNDKIREIELSKDPDDGLRHEEVNDSEETQNLLNRFESRIGNFQIPNDKHLDSIKSNPGVFKVINNKYENEDEQRARVSMEDEMVNENGHDSQVEQKTKAETRKSNHYSINTLIKTLILVLFILIFSFLSLIYLLNQRVVGLEKEAKSKIN